MSCVVVMLSVKPVTTTAAISQQEAGLLARRAQANSTQD